MTLLRGEPDGRSGRLPLRGDGLSLARMHALSHLDRLEAESIHILRESPYEPPERPDIRIDTTEMSAQDAAELIVEELMKRR